MACVPNGWPPGQYMWVGATGATGPIASTNVVSNITTNTVVTSNALYIGVRSNGSADVTLTMPLGSTLPVGKSFIIKDESGRASFVGYRPVIQMSGTDLLDGQSTTTIAVNYAALQIMWVDGNSNTWSII